MNGRRKKSKDNKTKINSKKIIRCSNRMIPVFETDTCDNFKNKTSSETINICKNCLNSF
jgi:hypothetical protein